MQAKETVMVVCGTWSGFSVNAHNGRLALASNLARITPPGRNFWFSVERKPTAEACIEAFQKARDAKVDWILWMDDDVVVQGDVYERLREVADAKERPVVSALGFFRQPPFWPSIFRYDRLGDGTPIPVEKPLPWLDYPRNQLVRVDATGLCACLVHTSVLDKIKEPWFSWLAASTGGNTPDGMFMYRLSEAEIPIYCHTAVKVGHETSLVVNEEVADDWLAKHGRARSVELMQRNFRPFRPVEESKLVPVDAGRDLVSANDGRPTGTDAVCGEMVDSQSGAVLGGRESTDLDVPARMCGVCGDLLAYDLRDGIFHRKKCSCHYRNGHSPVARQVAVAMPDPDRSGDELCS